MKKARSILLLFLSISLSLSAQWNCPSKMNAHMHAFGESSPLSWSSEMTAGAGVLGDRIINNGMVFAGLEYYKNNVELYLEGGYKYWRTQENGQVFDSKLLGMREAYIGFNPGIAQLKIGLQSLQLNDQFIFNERMVGATLNRKDNGISLQAAAGTVSRKFARNGAFCSKCFLYDIRPNQARSYLAPQPFEEFFSAFVFSFEPDSYKKKTTQTVSNDEFQSFDEFNSKDFSSDEFSSDEFSNTTKKTKFLTLDNYGALAYTEWGNYYPDPKLWTGLFGKLTLLEKINYRLEALYQYQDQNTGLLLVNSLQKQIKTSLGITDVNASYYYFKGFDNNAYAALSYTNLFLGEVLRYDVIEMPLLSVYAKHRFIGKHMSLKLQYASTTGNNKNSEIDLEFTKNFKKFQVSTTLAHLSGKAVDAYPYLARLEVRYNF